MDLALHCPRTLKKHNVAFAQAEGEATDMDRIPLVLLEVSSRVFFAVLLFSEVMEPEAKCALCHLAE